MPKVGERHYSYDKKGMAEAKAEAKRTGQKVERPKQAPPKGKK